ncbi:MAG TPA: cupin domain-containing protein [Kribbella sp.]|nr:cupin domain-containing protein [Kribbella sp.]
MSARRVVTGTGPDGRSFVVTDEAVQPVTVAALPGYAWHRLWAFDTLPADPAEPRVADGLTHFPPVGGVRFTLFTVPPGSTERPPFSEADHQAELNAKLPGRSAHMEPDQDGMHRTASVDLVVVLSGKVSLELDDGRMVGLRAGDSVVQNGTRHAWRNVSQEPCTLGIVLVGTVVPD